MAAGYLQETDGTKSSTRLMSFGFFMASIVYGFLILYAEVKLKADMPNSMMIFWGLMGGCGALKLGNEAIKKSGGQQ